MIKSFMTLAETLSYTKAASQLFITQPVLSRYIQKLESELELKLFVRNSKQVTLTPAGNVYYEGLKVLNKQYYEVLSQAMDADKGYDGIIKIGVLAGTTFGPLKSVIHNYSDEHPNIAIQVSGENLFPLQKGLKEGTFDITYGPVEVMEKYSFFSCFPLVRFPLYLFFSSDHPAAIKAASEGRKPELIDFADCHFLMAGDQSDAQRFFISECLSMGFTPNLYAMDNALDPPFATVAARIETGSCVALLHSDVSLKGHPAYSYIEIDPDLNSVFGLCWNNTAMSPQLDAFLDFIKSQNPSLVSDDLASDNY